MPAPACLLAAATLVAAGCRLPRALDPAGPQAERIVGLWWLFFAVVAVVYAIVVVVLVAAAARRRRDGELVAVVPGDSAWIEPRRWRPAAGVERRLGKVVAAAVAVTALVLLALLVASVTTGRGLASAPLPTELEVEVTGHQWWWSVRYPHENDSWTVTTANEIHLPVGRPVRLALTSSDVIHSFWVPRLHGKRDLIPRRTNYLLLRVDRPGVYAGQCAEFCGHQHAHMGLVVVAEPPEAFARWLAAQRRPARPPRSDLERQGQRVFLTNACMLCHSIRGTPAGGRTGPDLTHLASRRTLATGTLPNRVGHLAGWIMDPQAIKPGTAMPRNALSGPELQALLAYLRSLE